jgi:hypothetical protein
VVHRLVFILLVLFSGVGSAAATGPWQVEAKGRYGWPKAQSGGTELFKSSFGGEVLVANRVHANWSIAAGYHYLRMEATGAFRADYFLRYGTVEKDGYRQQAAFALVRYHFQDNVLHPHFAAGMGVGKVHHTQGGGGFDGWGTDWLARLGLAYHAGERWRILGEASYDVLQGQQTNITTFAVNLGAGYAF